MSEQSRISDERERSFQMLEAAGVSRDRAKSVDNGIGVLVGRYDKAIHDLEQELAALRRPVGPRQEAEAIRHLQSICDFAYEQGFHEIGYDPVDTLVSRNSQLRRALRGVPQDAIDGGWNVTDYTASIKIQHDNSLDATARELQQEHEKCLRWAGVAGERERQLKDSADDIEHLRVNLKENEQWARTEIDSLKAQLREQTEKRIELGREIARLKSPAEERREVAERQHTRKEIEREHGQMFGSAIADIDTLLADATRLRNAYDDRVRMLGKVQDELSARNRECVELREKCERLETSLKIDRQLLADSRNAHALVTRERDEARGKVERLETGPLVPRRLRDEAIAENARLCERIERLGLGNSKMEGWIALVRVLVEEFELSRGSISAHSIDVARAALAAADVQQTTKPTARTAEHHTIEKLEAALRRIDAINDTPAAFNIDIQGVLDSVIPRGAADGQRHQPGSHMCAECGSPFPGSHHGDCTGSRSNDHS